MTTVLFLLKLATILFCKTGL